MKYHNFCWKLYGNTWFIELYDYVIVWRAWLFKRIMFWRKSLLYGGHSSYDYVLSPQEFCKAQIYFIVDWNSAARNQDFNAVLFLAVIAASLKLFRIFFADKPCQYVHERSRSASADLCIYQYEFFSSSADFGFKFFIYQHFHKIYPPFLFIIQLI